MITIRNATASRYDIAPDDMVEGRAYMDSDGTVYICNKYGELIASSICGRSLVFEGNTDLRYREVDLEIIVK